MYEMFCLRSFEMRKTLSAILIFSLIMCCTACGGKTSPDSEGTLAADGNDTSAATVVTDEVSVPIGDDNTARLIYENDFSSGMDGVRVLYGGFEVRDGMLRCTKSKNGGYSTLLFETEKLSDFVYEADFIDHRGGGGLLFLCDSDAAATNSSDAFCGYMAYVGKDGGLGAMGCSSPNGKWSGNFAVSTQNVTDPGADLHLRVRVSGDFIIYTMTDIASGNEVYRYEYKKGDSKKYDTQPYLSGAIGLRMYNDSGAAGFDNIKVYATKDVSISDICISTGETADMAVKAEKDENLITFTSDGTGYAVSYDASVERVMLYRYNGGELSYIAEHAQKIDDGAEYAVRVKNASDALTVYFEDTIAPVFEIPHSGGKYNIGSSSRLGVKLYDTSDAFDTLKGYTNPVADGADPEVIYHQGKYYLYTSHNKKVRVRTSVDLVNWEEAGYAFTLPTGSDITSFMSPNVFFSDGLFYLIIASRTGGSSSSTDFKLYYASSSSPTGPFAMKGDRPYINDTNEIGGAPFVDEDGRIYISSVRFGGGNHIYIQEIKATDGIITPLTEAVHCISPTEHYEIDEYGRITEGGVIVKHGDYYYMMYASGHYKGHYGEAYATSKSIFGPWEKYEYNDVLNSNIYADGVGDCVFVRSPGGELFVMYHRHTEIGNEGKTRSICIDRVYFVPSEDGGPDVLRIYGPTVTAQPVPECISNN